MGNVMIPEDVATLAGGPEPIGPPGAPPMARATRWADPTDGWWPTTDWVARPPRQGWRACSAEATGGPEGMPPEGMPRRGGRRQRGRHPLRDAGRARWSTCSVASDDIEKAKMMQAAAIVQDLLASNQKEARRPRGSAPPRRGWRRPSARWAEAEASRWHGVEEATSGPRSTRRSRRSSSMIRRAEHAYHDAWRSECDKRHDEYHAIVDVPEDVPDWQSQIFQPHLIPIIEGMIASMVEPNPRLVVRPRPAPAGDARGGEARADAAEIAAVAVNYALEQDRFRMKQRPFMQQDMITGLTVGKYSWDERKKKVWTREFHEEEEYDDESQTYEMVRGYDGHRVGGEDPRRPDLQVLDVRDFYWPANCRDVEQADWLVDRQYLTARPHPGDGRPGDLRQGHLREAEGDVARPGRLAGRAHSLRRGRHRGADPHQGPGRGDRGWWSNRVVTIGNREVLMRDKPNGFWHGQQAVHRLRRDPELRAGERQVDRRDARADPADALVRPEPAARQPEAAEQPDLPDPLRHRRRHHVQVVPRSAVAGRRPRAGAGATHRPDPGQHLDGRRGAAQGRPPEPDGRDALLVGSAVHPGRPEDRDRDPDHHRHRASG